MSSIKQFFEWYLGVPASGPGEGTAWHLEFETIGPQGWPPTIVIGLGVLMFLLIAGLSAYESRRFGWRHRALLLALRLGAWAVIVAMISQLSLAVDRTGLPVVALLIDDSASMSLFDQAEGAESKRSRLERVQEFLAKDDGQFFAELSRRFRVRVYRFDEEVELLLEGGLESSHGLSPKIRTLSADGAATRPAHAAREVLDDLRGLSPSALVIFTDGVSTTGPRDLLSAAATLASRRKVPVFPVGVGRQGPRRDLDLFELVGDEVGFWGDPVRVGVRLRAFGLEGKPVAVTIIDSSTGDELARTTTPARADGETSQVELTFVPERDGQIDFEARASVGVEESNPHNNRKPGRVRVRKEKLRVLLADHAPRYEFRFLKSLLSREPTIQLDTVLQEADLGYAQQDETGLDRFPLQAKTLFEYDVIIFGDLDPALLGNDVLAALATFVRERGGALIGIVGPRFFPKSYGGTPLADVLPAPPESVQIPGEDDVLDEAMRPRLTLQAERSGSMFRFDEDPAESRRIWENLPGFYWIASTKELQPGAVPLATVSPPGESLNPVIILQRFGAGRTLLHMTDETWRWRFRRGDLYYGRYWIQSIRYLSSVASSGSGEEGPAMTLSTDRREYVQGESVRFRARVRAGHSFEPNLLEVVLEEESGSRQVISLSRLGELSATFEGFAQRLAAGSYHAWIRMPEISTAPSSADFEVAPPRRELSQPVPDLADLRRAAQETGGHFFRLDEAGVLSSRLPAGRPIRLRAASPLPLWSRPELLFALAGCLALEWWLRKRGRLA